MAFSGNIKAFTFDEWRREDIKDAVRKSKKVRCPKCDGSGEIEEEIQSRQGNWHKVYEDCERCDGFGKVYACDLSENELPHASFEEYRSVVIESIRGVSLATRTSFFDNICNCKEIRSK